ncbi:YncE family protein [Burkholderia sp. MR1-5-21]
MKHKTLASFLLAMGTVACAASLSVAGTADAAPAPDDAHFAIAKRFPLAGAERWDYVGYDAARHHLFVSRDTHVQVLDTESGKQVGDIANTPGVHGFAFVESSKLGFITNGRADTITVVDLDSLQTVDTIKAGGPDPDGILYVRDLGRLFVSNGHDKSVSAIDVGTRKVIATMSVGGKPESLAADRSGHVFVAAEDTNEIVEMDGRANKVLNHWALADCDGPSGLAIDADTDRLFTTCANGKMAVVDASTGRKVAALPIGGHPDFAAFDPELKTAFSSNGGDGTLTVVHERDRDHFEVVQNVRTQTGAKTMALDDRTHRVYLVSAQFSAPATSANPHPDIVPDTFNVLVAERGAAKAGH